MEVIQRVRVVCPRCQAPVTGDFKFCPTCAYRLKPGSAAVEPFEAARPRRAASMALAVTAALFVGLFAGVGIWLFRDRTPEPLRTLEPAAVETLAADRLRAANFRKYLLHVPSGTAYWAEDASDGTARRMFVDDLEVLRYEVPCPFFAEFLTDQAERVLERGEAPGPTLEHLWNAKTPEEIDFAQRYLSTWVETYLRRHGVTPTEATPPPDALLRWVPEERRRAASGGVWAYAQAVAFPWPKELGLLLLVPPSWAYVNPWEQMRWIMPPGSETLPVTDVAWNDALAFSEWLGARLGPHVEVRLPVAGEWMRIAHGGHPPLDPAPEGDWLYPWGSSELYTACNNSDLYPRGVPPILQPVGQKYLATDGTVVRDGRTVDGIYAMAGNVSEWVLTQGERVQRINESLRVYYDPEGDAAQWNAYAYGGSFRSRLLDCTVQSAVKSLKYARSEEIGFRLVTPRRL